MLEKVDLTRSLGKQEYREIRSELREKLYWLQKTTWEAKIPVVIVVEGWDAAGKGDAMRTLTARLDPRGFKVHAISSTNGRDEKMPWLWRYWLRMPARGQWSFFERSWYQRVLLERVEKFTPETQWRRAYHDIVSFERTYSDDGCVILKFFMHISKREQKKRFKKLSKDPRTAWQVTAEDWEHHSNYQEYGQAIEDILELTEAEWAPWTIVEATDKRFARLKIMRTIVAALEKRLLLDPPSAQDYWREETPAAENDPPQEQQIETAQGAEAAEPPAASPGAGVTRSRGRAHSANRRSGKTNQ